MLTFLPIVLLLVSSVVIQVVGRITRRPGSTWWLAAILGAISWLSVILVGLLDPAEVVFQNWLPSPSPSSSIVLRVTPENWVFGFLLITMLQASIFHNARHLESQSYLNKLTGLMVFTAFGLLAVFSRSSLAFILSWTLIDLAEFGVLSVVVGVSENHRTKITSVIFRAIGIILLVLALSLSPEKGVLQESTTPMIAWLLLVIAVSRMGILPLNSPFTRELNLSRDLVTILKVLPVITAFAFLSTMPSAAYPTKTTGLLLFLFTVGALFGAVSWYFSRDELGGRSYWLFALGSLGMISYLAGATQSVIGLAVAAVVSGSGIFLYFPRFTKWFPYLPLLLLAALTIPFTPTSSITLLFNKSGGFVNQLWWVISYTLLLAGVVKHALVATGDRIDDVPWVRLFHGISLYFLAFSPWIIVGVVFAAVKPTEKWWISIVILGLTLSLVVGRFFLGKGKRLLNHRYAQVSQIGRRAITIMDGFFKLNWLGKLITSLGVLFEKIVGLLTRVLEGDGGILWSFLFLVLMVSLLFSR